MRIIFNALSVIYSFFRFLFIKIFHWKNFNYSIVERFSPNTIIEIRKNGSIKIGKKVRAHRNVKLSVSHNGIIEIGNNTSFNDRCIVVSHKKILIGCDCAFGPGVLIYDHDHDFRNSNKMNGKEFICEDITIGNNCWIGANSIILRGTTLGDNCVVAAGTVLKGKYDSNTIIYNKKETICKKYK